MSIQNGLEITVEVETGEIEFTGGGDVDIDVETTISREYTFNRETGEYTLMEVSTSEDEENFGQSYYTFDANLQTYVYGGTYIRMIERTETYNESGLFTISGEAGETIEANTQIVLQRFPVCTL